MAQYLMVLGHQQAQWQLKSDISCFQIIWLSVISYCCWPYGMILNDQWYLKKLRMLISNLSLSGEINHSIQDKTSMAITPLSQLILPTYFCIMGLIKQFPCMLISRWLQSVDLTNLSFNLNTLYHYSNIAWALGYLKPPSTPLFLPTACLS